MCYPGENETAIPNSYSQTIEFIIFKVLSAATITENDIIVVIVGTEGCDDISAKRGFSCSGYLNFISKYGVPEGIDIVYNVNL